jgi:hypothetical protein
VAVGGSARTNSLSLVGRNSWEGAPKVGVDACRRFFDYSPWSHGAKFAGCETVLIDEALASHPVWAYDFSALHWAQ